MHRRCADRQRWRLVWMVFAAVCWPTACPAQAVTDDVKDAPSVLQPGETYRFRVQNAEFGRVEVSVDGGLTYALIGRVRRPATGTVADTGASTPGMVLRCRPDGLALSVAKGRAIKLRCEHSSTGPGAPTIATAFPEMSTNLQSGRGLFGDLTPAIGTEVRLQAERRSLAPLSDNHILSTDDTFVFVVRSAMHGASSNFQQPDITRRLDALARSYAATAVARARSEKRSVANGILTLRAKLPDAEPDPIAAVTYSIDDALCAAQNVAPFSFDWDTRRTADGEHVVEISALNRNGHLITSARALVVVNNAQEPAK